MRDEILAASVRTIIEDGLASWTVDRVAHRAGCAKGLVPYHHGSRAALLKASALALAAARAAARAEALSGQHGVGVEAIDALWSVMRAEVASGKFAAWLAVSADPELRSAALQPGSGGREPLADALARALDLPPEAMPPAEAVQAVLDGCQLQLLAGAPERDVREAHERLWITLIQ